MPVTIAGKEYETFYDMLKSGEVLKAVTLSDVSKQSYERFFDLLDKKEYYEAYKEARELRRDVVCFRAGRIRR